MLAGQSRNASNGAVVADQGCFIRSLKTRHGVDDRVGDLEPAGRLGQLLDQPDELVAAVAVVAGESDELSGFDKDGAPLRGAADGDATPSDCSRDEGRTRVPPRAWYTEDSSYLARG